MDIALNLMETGFVFEGVGRLMHTLAERRRTLGAARWPGFAREVLAHPIREYVHADPLTRRCFTKPRGYAGDAVMMDYIYGLREEALSAPASDIFRHNVGTRMAHSVRTRRQILAQTIDATAGDLGRPVDVIAIASGHLREVELSVAAQQGQAQITALDADPESLAVVTDAYSGLGAMTRHGSVRQILSGKVTLPKADLVYSAGLYDYLTTPVATRLTSLLFDALRPGGRLLLANFLPNLDEVGYMESFMDWHLIYRTDAEMLELIGDARRDELARVRQFHDDGHNIAYLELHKR